MLFSNFQMITTFIIHHFWEPAYLFGNPLYFAFRSATSGYYQILSYHMTVKSFLSKMISQISNDYNFHHRSLPRARLSSLQSSILHLSICDKCALPNVIVLHDSQTISFNFFNFQMIITFIIDHFRESD